MQSSYNSVPYAKPMLSPSELSTREAVPLDELLGKVLEREPAADGLLFPIVGWSSIALVLLDVIGNLAGIPVASGTLLALADTHPNGLLVALTLAVQLAALLIGFVLLFHSPWRVWVVEISDETRRREQRKSMGWENLWRRPLHAGAVPDARALFALAWIAMLAFVGSVSITGLCVILIVLTTLVLIFRAVFLGVFFERIFSDRGSMTGVVLGTVLALMLLLLVAAPQEFVGSYFRDSWHDPHHSWFRAFQLFLLAALAGWIFLLPTTKINNDLVVFVSQPHDEVRVYYDFSNIVKFAGRRVTANLDLTLLRDVVVLVRGFDGGYRTVPRSHPLHLNEEEYLILYLPALHLLDGKFPLHDRRGYFLPEGVVCATPRPLSDTLPMTAPARVLEPLLGLLASDRLAGELRRVAQDAFDTFVFSIQGMGEQLDVQFRLLEGEVDNIPLELDSGLAVSGNLISWNGVEIVNALTELERRHAALQRIRACRDEGGRLLNHWLDVVSHKVVGHQVASDIFEKRLRERFVGQSELAQTLFAHCGFALRVTLEPAAGTAGRGDQMAERLNVRCREVSERVLIDIDTTQKRLLTLLVQNMKLQDGRSQLALKSLLTMMPQLFPYFRNRPEHLLRFVEFAIRQFGGPVKFEQVQQLLNHQPHSSTPLSPPTV